ncbi:MAG: hypothetical protein GY821_17010 [Gammaproteobacteria bacterium]|nr:hypothetical protein [Gammaproteobacteria bacterium]
MKNIKKNSSVDLIHRLNSQDSNVENQIVILSFASESLMAGARDCLKKIFSKKNYAINTFNLKTLARQKSHSLKNKKNDGDELKQKIANKGKEIKPLLSKNTTIYICCHGYVNDTKNCYAENSKDNEADIMSKIDLLFSAEQLANFIKQMLGDDLASVEDIKLFICYSARTSDYKSHHIKNEIDPSDSFLAEFSQKVAFDHNYVKVTGYTGPVRPDAFSEKKLLIGTEKLILGIHPIIKLYRMKSEQVIRNALLNSLVDGPYNKYLDQYVRKDTKTNGAFNEAVFNIMSIMDELMDKVYREIPEIIDLNKEIEDLLDSSLSESQKKILIPALECYLLTRIAEDLKGESIDYYGHEYGEVTFTMKDGVIECIDMASTSKSGQKFYYQFEFDDQENNEQQKQVVPASFSKKYEEEYGDKWKEDLQVVTEQVINNENANSNSNNSYFINCVIL